MMYHGTTTEPSGLPVFLLRDLLQARDAFRLVLE
jgi:hypothetical protein